MRGMTERFGPRRSTSAWDAASWVMAVVVLTLAIPASGKIAGNELFFTAHGVTIVGWIITLVLTLLVAWLVLVAILTAVARWTTPRVYDVVASTLLFVVSAFGLGNVFALTILSGSSASAFIAGAVAAAIVMLAARRLAMGRVLFACASIAVLLPLAGALTGGVDPQLPAATFAEGAPAPDVVWVIADEMQYPLVFDQDGRVRPEFPNMRALQQQSTTYTKAYTAANYTDFAIPAQFNGVTDLSALDDSAINRMKSSKGLIPGLAARYSIVMDSPLFNYVCESSDCATVSPDPNAGIVERYVLFMKDAAAIAGQTALTEPFNGVFPSLSGRWRDYWSSGGAAATSVDSAPVTRVIASIDKAKANQPDAPTFTFWHTLRTHAPWPLDRDGAAIYSPRLPVVDGAHLVGSDAVGHVSTADLESLERRLYANAAVDFDRQLGLLIDHLKQAGTYDSTMIVVTADHGAAITQSADRRRGDNDVQRWSEVAHVPLLVKSSGQEAAEQVTDPRSTGQIARTVMTVAGATPPSELPLSADLSAEPTGKIVFTDVSADPMPEWEFSGVAEQDPWLPDDLAPPDPDHPFAIGIDRELLGQPVPSGWTELEGARMDALPGDSGQVVLVVDPGVARCAGIRTPSLVSSAGVVIGALLWQANGDRAWAIVPRSPGADYRFWCPANTS